MADDDAKNAPETRSGHAGDPSRDPHVTGIRRGANPGPAGSTFPLSERTGDVASPRGANVPNEPGGPEGIVERENEDTVRAARRGEPG